MKGDEILRVCDHHSVEAARVIPNKCVAEYEQMQKWLIEFFSNFQRRGIKIDPSEFDSLCQATDFLELSVRIPSYGIPSIHCFLEQRTPGVGRPEL